MQRCLFTGGKTATVALGLLQRAGDIGVLAFDFNRSHRREADEEDVVSRAARGRLLGDRQVLPLLGACTISISDCRGVSLPTRLTELLVDEFPGLGLIEMNRGSGGVRGCDECGHGLFRLRDGQRLLCSQLLCESRLGAFGFDRHLFPEGLFVLSLAEPGFCGFEVLHGFVMSGSILLKLFGKTREFSAQVVGLDPWSKWRNEGAGLECRILESAVEPDANLSRDLECCERSTVIADQRMAGGVACPPDFAKELGNLTRKDALVLQATNEIVLRLLRRNVLADMGRDLLREQLCQLAQLEQRGVRVLWEIPFREQTQAQELLVMLCELSEVTLEGRHVCGPLMVDTCCLIQSAA